MTCNVPQSMTAGHRHDEVGGSHEGECRRHQTAAADKDGELRVSLARMKVPEPKDDEVVVRVVMRMVPAGFAWAHPSRHEDEADV